MKKFALLFSVLFIASCGDSSELKSLITERLTDPESVQFRDVVISENKQRACVVWNARNRMGGYGDWQLAEFEKIDSQWTATSLDGIYVDCTQAYFQMLDETKIALEEAIVRSEAGDAAREEVIQLFKTDWWLEEEEARFVAGHDCKSEVDLYVFHSSEIAMSRRQGDLEAVSSQEEEKERALEGLYLSDCYGNDR